MMTKRDTARRGQSLMDILIGVTLGLILIFAAVAALAPALQSGSQAARTQTAAWLANGMLNDVQTWANGDWHRILSVSTGTSYQYYLNTSSSPFVATSGIQNIVFATSSYWRYFSVSDVYRNTGTGAITTSGGSYDPSTKQVIVAYGWSGGPTSTISEYLTRNQSQVYSQVDWSSGPSSTSAAYTVAGPQFSSSTNINYSSPGTISVGTVAAAPEYGGTWIKVPGNPVLGTSDFYIMKYEAGCADATTNVPLTSPLATSSVNGYDNSAQNCSQANGLQPYAAPGVDPIVNVSEAQAASYCSAIGASLPTNAEWQTVAWNAENVASNWSGSAVGSGHMPGGHSDGTPNAVSVATSTDSKSCVGTDGPSSCGGTGTDGTQVRTLTLSNGNVIWDFSGNIWEWTSDAVSGSNQPHGSSPNWNWSEFTNLTTWGTMSRLQLGAANSTWTSTQGIGLIYSENAADASAYGFQHGGSWLSSTAFSGPQSVNLNAAPSSYGYSTGFRCVSGDTGTDTASVSYVQLAADQSELGGGSFPNVSSTFSSPHTSGDAVLVVIPYYTTGSDMITGCRDTNNPTSSYAEAASVISAAHNGGFDLWYGLNLGGGTTLKVTCTFSSPTTATMGALEVSGLAPVNALDATSTHKVDSGNPTSVTTGAATTHYSNEEVFGLFMGTNGQPYWTLTPGSGFTSYFPPGTGEGAGEFGYMTTPGSVTATGTTSVPDDYLGILASFKTVNSF